MLKIDFLDMKKIKNIAHAANHYVKKNNIDDWLRFDVVSIVGNPEKLKSIEIPASVTKINASSPLDKNLLYKTRRKRRNIKSKIEIKRRRRASKKSSKNISG